MSLIPGLPFFDWCVSKPGLAFLGVVNAGMGCVCAIGLLGFCRAEYNAIVAIMPFLIICKILNFLILNWFY